MSREDPHPDPLPDYRERGISESHQNDRAWYRAKLALIGCLAVAGLMILTGCTTEMEDGYKPKSLSAGPSQRKAYYASPFTPESEAGKEKSPIRPSFGGG